ncbi:MAG: AMP-binding protein [Panacagrimonas sp.]
MSQVLVALSRHAREQPHAIAIQNRSVRLSYAQVHMVVHRLADELAGTGARTLGLIADNGPAWALVDLACMAAGLRLVPLPPFFSESQRRHAMRDGGVDALMYEGRASGDAVALSFPEGLPDISLRLIGDPGVAVLPPGTQKITYTSGTTGEPRGVCLSVGSMERVAQALADASGATPGDVHLSALPLSTLLENIGGIYAPLLAGAATCLFSLEDVGVGGATRIDAVKMLAALRETRATSVILVPQMLQALIVQIERGAVRPDRLRFVAVGGAPVSPLLLDRARALGLPVFEGYGLSECASVVALNTPAASRTGSVGRPLPHLKLGLAPDGEVLVHGEKFLGYVGDVPTTADQPLATGDLGFVDDDGFLHLTGRKKNMFVTAFGRNVAPEWVERELCEEPVIAQVAVFGEAQPWNAAVIVARGSDTDVDAALERVNARLPDYARVRSWTPAREPFSPTNQQLTPNGRLRREAIFAAYRPSLLSLYEESFAS